MSDAVETEDRDEGNPSPVPKPKPKQQGGDAVEIAKRRLAQEEGKSVYDWISALGGSVPYRVQLYRLHPKFFKSKKVDGHLRTYDAEPVSEDDIREEFRGGKYQLKILVPNSAGSYQIVTARTVDIPGDPAPVVYGDDDRPPPTAGPPSEDPSVVAQALKMVERQSDADRRRAEHAENHARSSSALDPTLIELIIAPFKAQNDMLQKEIASIRSELKREDPLQNRVLDKLVDGDSARIQALQAQWSSERTMLLSQAAEDLKRAEARFDRTVDQLVRQHDRELADLKSSHTFQVESVKMAQNMALEAVKRECDNLRSLLTEAKSELAALRTQKNVGPVEQLTQLAAIREAFDEISGNKEETSGWEKAAEVVAPIFEAVGAGISNRVQNAQAPQQPPPGFVPQRPQGPRRRTVVRGPAPGAPGPQPAPPAAGAQPGAAQPPAPMQPQPPQAGPGAPPQQQRNFSLDAQEVAIAIQFIENAIANGQDPTVFANSFRSLIPRDIVQAIRTLGVDAFLDQVAELVPPGSRIDSVEGRTFIHEVAKLLT